MVSFKEIAYGIGSGYLQKVVQIGTTVVMIPLIISDAALGLSGYGELMTYLTLGAFFSMILDGVRLSIARKVGQQQGSGNHGLGVSLVTMLAALFFPIAIFLIFGKDIFEFSGLVTKDSRIVFLLIFLLVFEHFNYILEQYYHSLGLTWRINFITIVEVVVRFVFVVLAVFYYQFSIEWYLFIFVITFFIKFSFYSIELYRKNVFSVASMSFKVEEVKGILHYSWPLSMKGLATFFVYRFGVIVCNKVIGSEASAVYSLIFTTLRNYFSQIFVAVLRPMVIPVMAAKKLSDISLSNIKNLTSMLRVYELVVVAAVLFIGFTVDIWLKLWLGDAFMQYSLLFSISIIIIALEVVSGVKALLLVSQGYGRPVSFYSLIFAAILILALFIIMVVDDYATVENVVYATLLYIVFYNGLALMSLFKAHLGSIDADKYIVRLFVYFCSGAMFFALREYSIVLAATAGLMMYFSLVLLFFNNVVNDFKRVLIMFLPANKLN